MKNPSERLEQKALVQRLKNEGIFVTSIPNGVNFDNNSNKIAKFKEIAMLKNEGLLPGMTDLIIILENHVIFLEMKKEGGKISKEQEKVHKQLKELGQDVQVFYNAKSAWGYIDNKRKEIDESRFN